MNIQNKRSLEELKDRARLALKHKELIEVAKRFTPTAAHEKALAMHYSESEAQSCRFLAIIVRDHGGAEAVARIQKSDEEAELDRYLSEELAPGIGFLEKIGGGKLMIVRPEDRGLSLIDHLTQSKACTIDLELSLGEYCILFSYQLESDRGHYQMSRNMVVIRDGEKLKALDHHGKPADEEQKCKSNCCDGGEHPGTNELRRRLYRELKNCLFVGCGFLVESASSLIFRDLEQRGHKTAPRLWKYCKGKEIELWQYREYGLVDQFSDMAKGLRQQAIADGVGAQALAYLDLEIHLTRQEVMQSNKAHDDTVPLLEKIQSKTLDVWVRCQVVPGPKAAKTYVFLYHNGHLGAYDLVRNLEKLGYGGSVVISFFNLPSGLRVASTGQCDAFLQDWSEHRDCGSKATFLADAQKYMENAGKARSRANIPKVPYGMVSIGKPDHKLLEEHFPLA